MKVASTAILSGKILNGTAKPNLRGFVAGIESIVVGHILSRNAQGLDINGNPHKPYHPDYSLKRRLSGRSDSPVQLIWSGKMMNAVGALSKMVDESRFVVVFGVRPRDERNLIGAYLQRKRKWFGISPDGMRELREWMSHNLKAALYGMPLSAPPRPPRPPPIRQEQRTDFRKEARKEQADRRAASAEARRQRRETGSR